MTPPAIRSWPSPSPSRSLGRVAMAARPVRRHRDRGFTLVEVLVSLLILAVMAATAWKGMDGIGRAREIADGNLRRTLRLQSVMTQFDADMASVMETLVVPGLQFDGANLRLTRRSGTGVQMVVWSLRRDRWVRWASTPVTRYGPLKDLWTTSFQLQGKEAGTLTALKGVAQWQVYCFRSGGWSNCQSSGDVTRRQALPRPPTGGTGGSPPVTPPPVPPVAHEQLPVGIRLNMTLGEGSGFSGVLTRDVLLAPQMNAE